MRRICFNDTTKRSIAILVTLLILSRLASNQVLIEFASNINNYLHDSFSDFIYKNFPAEQSSFIISILVGSSNQNLSKDLYYLFKKFNLIHVISISGSNFALIQSILDNLKILISKKYVVLVIVLIHSIYYLIIGFDNAPALRAFIFALFSNYSSLAGRPIRFYKKIVFTVLIVYSIKPELLFTKSFVLSTSFAIFYHLLGQRPLNRIFNNEIKRIALIFILSSLIFSSQAPDFLANLLFSLLYPVIFISIFTAYLLSLFVVNIPFLVNMNSAITLFIFEYFKELSTIQNRLIQILLFLAILIITVKDLFRKSKNEISINY